MTGERMQELLDLWRQGYKVSMIGSRMGITANTVSGKVDRARANGILPDVDIDLWHALPRHHQRRLFPLAAKQPRVPLRAIKPAELAVARKVAVAACEPTLKGAAAVAVARLVSAPVAAAVPVVDAVPVPVATRRRLDTEDDTPLEISTEWLETLLAWSPTLRAIDAGEPRAAAMSGRGVG
jgi:hypothetical protein